jgi:hypothetical protein
MGAGRLLRATPPRAGHPGRAAGRLAVRVLELVVAGVVLGMYVMLAVVAPVAYEVGL